MNETIPTASTVVAAYAGAVRDELADLRDDDRVDLMEDVAEHVAAVATEYADLSMEMLVDRLGPPTAYAAELREAAGLAATPRVGAEADGRRDGFFRRLGRFVAVVLALIAVAMVPLAIGIPDTGPLWAAGIVAAAAAGVFALLIRDGRDWKDEVNRVPGASVLRRARVRFVEQTWSAEAVDLIVSLRPGWWVLRGAALAVALGMFTNSVPVIVVSILPLVALSVWLGRRSMDRRPRGAVGVAVFAANGALALTAIGAAMGVYGKATEPPIYVSHDPYQEAYVDTGPVGDGMVHRDDGSLVTNLFPYGPDGRLLEDVRLYDQDGRPFELGLAEGCDEWGEPDWVYLPHSDPANAFPHRLIEVDPNTGECLDPVTVPPFGPFLPGSPVTESTSESTSETTPQSTAQPSATEPSMAATPDVPK